MDPLKELVEQKLKERGWTESDLTPRFLEAGFGKRDPVLHSLLAGRTYDSEAFDVLCRALDIRDDELRTALEERLARLEAERDAALDRLHDPLVDFSETARDTEQRAEPIRLWLGVPQLEAPAAPPKTFLRPEGSRFPVMAEWRALVFARLGHHWSITPVTCAEEDQSEALGNTARHIRNTTNGGVTRQYALYVEGGGDPRWVVVSTGLARNLSAETLRAAAPPGGVAGEGTDEFEGALEQILPPGARIGGSAAPAEWMQAVLLHTLGLRWT